MSYPETVLLGMDQVRTPTSKQGCPLGTRGVTRDGRVFRYSRCGTTAITDPSCLLRHKSQITYALSSSGANDLSSGDTFTSTWTYVNVGMSGYTTAIATNYFKEGYLWFGSCASTYGEAEAVRGTMLQIKGHLGTTASSTEFLKFDLYEDDRLNGDVSSSNGVGIFHHPNDRVEMSAAAAAAVAGGSAIGVNITPVTALYYFWAQTWGPCPLKLAISNTMTVGLGVSATTEADSTGISAIRSTGEIVVGYRYTKIGTVMVTEGVGQYVLIDLRISP